MTSCPLYFAPAIASNVAANHVLSSSAKTSKKRKRNPASSEDILKGQTNESALDLGNPIPVGDFSGAQVPSLALSPAEMLSPNIESQLNVTGQPRHEALPRGNFPHAFPRRLQDDPVSRSESSLIDELAQLRPPLRTVRGSSSPEPYTKATALRRRHQKILTTMMHKSLLENDFIRAGRAWGMLLRAEQGGHSFDPRTNARWGLGAEFLVLRHVQVARPNLEAVRRAKDDVLSNQYSASKPFSSLQGAAQAKDYYERLILQYPHRKFAPTVTGPQEFHLASFGLWVYALKEQYLLSIADIEKGTVGPHLRDIMEVGRGPNLSSSALKLSQYRQKESVRQKALQGARDIALHLDEMLNAPPYSDDPRFWRLLGVIHTWVGNLSLVIKSPRIAAGNSHEINFSASRATNLTGTLDEEKFSFDDMRKTGQIEQEKALADAQNAFEKAKSYREPPTLDFATSTIKNSQTPKLES